MATDKNNKSIKIGDIVKIEGSPIKNDNGIYVVEQDGTSEFYSGTDLTLWKVCKTKTGYRLSHTKGNLSFYPLRNFSNKYKFTREEMAAATIEVIKEAQPQAVEFKEVDRRMFEEMKMPYICIEIKKGDDSINVSYLTKQIGLAKAFLSNIEFVEGEEIKVKEMDNDGDRWGRRSYIAYEVVKGEPVQTAPAAAEEKPQETAQETTAPATAEEKPQETTQTQEQPTGFTAKNAPVSEELAKRAKENISFSDYQQGTATARANSYTDFIIEYANKLLKDHPTADPEKLEKAQYYIDKYSQKIAAAIDKENSITCRCPSILITGAGNFPTRKKEKQNAAAEAHWRATKDLYETDSRNYYFNKIRLILTDSGVIKSDDPKAVEKIKAKIAKLETLPDPYGNKKAEIRRLKERLLQLAPEEVKQGKEITINGEPATFESIVKIFDNIKPQRSQHRSTDESYYLPMVEIVFSDGNRKYKEYLSNQVNEDLTQIYSYTQHELIDFNNYMKFDLVISKIHGSGNKAVIYQILKDLDPRIIEAKEKAQEQKQEDRAESINGEEVTIVENTEIMRLQILFEGIPAKETRDRLKSNGFKWSPKNKAWQRLLNDNAKSALTDILDK